MDETGTALLEPEATPLPDTASLEQPDLSAFDVAAKRVRRSVVNENSPNPVNVRQLPQVFDEATYAAVPMGGVYLNPNGEQKTKPWQVMSQRDYDRVPEGGNYFNPEGEQKTKPKFESVGYTTQTLHDMALTPKQKRAILEREYPGQVQEDNRGLYVIDEQGTYRRPGYGTTAVTGGASALAAPVAGAVLGTLGGGAAGALGGPAGVFAGGTVGSMAGSYSGQWFNDFVLQMAGFGTETAEDKSLENQRQIAAGLSGALGAGVGRGISMVVPTIREGLSKAGAAGPAVMRKVMGATEEDLRMGTQIQGRYPDNPTTVPPSTVFKEAPHLQNLSERFHPALDTSNPSVRSIEQHYERGATDVLQGLGVPEAQLPRQGSQKLPSVLEPSASPPTQRVGEALKERALQESAVADQALQATLEARKQALTTGTTGTTGAMAQREAVLAAQVEAKRAADRLVQVGLDDMAQTADAAMRVTKAGHNGGDLWQMVGDKLASVKQGLTLRAEKMYNDADALVPPGVKPDARGLSRTADTFLEQLPGDFQKNNPDIVKKLRDLAGVKNEAGEWVKEPIEPTFGQLRNLRSLLRGNADWHTLSSDLKNGTYKFFSHEVDTALRNVERVPELADAVRQLDLADAFYRENMPVFHAQQIKAVMRGLEAGEPADPMVLYNAIVKEGHTDLTKHIRQMVGENLWSGVKAADMKTILANSEDLVRGVTNGNKFVTEVLDRARSGVLDAVHGKEGADRIRKLAQEVRALSNDRIPITVTPGDTVLGAIAKARQAAIEAKTAANKDPMAVLQKEMKQVEREAQRQPQVKIPDPENPGQFKMVARKDDPLGFLYDPTVGASAAANKIIASDDTLLAVATRFGKDSPEFNMVRQLYAQKLLEGSPDLAGRLAKVSEATQSLMFPGVTKTQMETLAKEMRFLTNSKLFQQGDVAGGMAAMNKVENPIAGRLVSGILKMAPGVNMAGRTALGVYYKTVTDLAANNPALFHYMLRGLGGTAEEKQAVRAILTKHAQRYAAMGAGVGESVYQMPKDARKAPDGRHYVPDPNRPGKFLRVDKVK